IDFEMDLYQRDLARVNGDVSELFKTYGSFGGSPKYYSPLYNLNRMLAQGEIAQDGYDERLASWRNNDFYQEYRDLVWHNESSQRYNANISQVEGNSNSYASFNFYRKNARVRRNEDQRFRHNMKSTFNLTNWLQATVGINGTYSYGQATDNVYNTLQVQERYTRIMDANGNPVVQP